MRLIPSFSSLSLFNASQPSVTGEFMPPPVTEEVYCFLVANLFSALIGVSYLYNLKGLWEYIPKSIPSVWSSVCTTILKRIAELHFCPKSIMLYINGFLSISLNELYKLMESLIQILNFWPKTEFFSKA